MAEYRRFVASATFSPAVPAVSSGMNVAAASPAPSLEEAVSLALGPKGRGEVSGVSGSPATDTSVVFPD